MTKTSDWSIVNGFQLQKDEVHVWQARTDVSDSVVGQLYDLLSPDERRRAHRFHFSSDRSRYVFVRGTLRSILGRYLEIPPEQITFEYGEFGKPRLGKSSESLFFNLSHSCDLALFAFSHNHDLGVDIEFVREDVDVEQLANRFFSDDEIASLLALPSGLRVQGFFNCWTRKEAFIKGTGKGLAMPLKQFTVSQGSGESLELISNNSQATSNWGLRELTADPDYVAAIAVAGHGWNLKSGPLGFTAFQN